MPPAARIRPTVSEATIQALALGGSAFLIGLTGAMSPGPYLTVTITRTVTKGPRSAALMLVGHALLEAGGRDHDILEGGSLRINRGLGRCDASRRQARQGGRHEPGIA